MSLCITSLNSGSNGNCYYIANNQEAVLVDAGISCRETEKRMTRLGLSMKNIKAIFISHEHSDHINGVEVLSKKYELPVYITSETYRNSGLHLDKKMVRSFNAYEEVEIGDLSVTAFPKFHDAADPYSFIVSGNGINIGVFTDIGSECEHVARNFGICHAAFLEANYDHAMLTQGRYPIHLQNRIKGNHGHLSNDQALEIFQEYRSEFLSHLFLSHLSKENNSPQLVQELFDQHAGDTKIVIASRYQETEVYQIRSNHIAEKPFRIKPPIVRKDVQMKLF